VGGEKTGYVTKRSRVRGFYGVSDTTGAFERVGNSEGVFEFTAGCAEFYLKRVRICPY
jgi:uncharacterized protein YutD